MDDLAARRRRQWIVASCVLSTATLASTVQAQTGPDLLLGGFGEHENAVFSGDGLFLMKSESDNDSEDVGLTVFNSQGRVKLDLDQFAKDWNLNRAQPRAGYDFTHIAISSDDANLPDQLTDMSVGFGMGIAAGQKYRAGLSVGVGYAAANVFGDGNAVYAKADFIFGYDFNERETLAIVLDYNGNRTFLPDVPLPGLIYRRKLADSKWEFTVGFPFSDVTWRPDDNWTIFLRYNIPAGGEANVEYKLTESLRVFASYQQQNEAFHWNELSDGDDRVIFSQSRVELGLRGTYQDKCSFILAGGYAFDQSFEVGWDSRDTDDLAELDSEPYVRVGVEFKF